MRERESRVSSAGVAIESEFFPSDEQVAEHGVRHARCFASKDKFRTMTNLLFPERPKCACGKEFATMKEFIAHYLESRPVVIPGIPSRWRDICLPPEISMHIAKHNLVNMAKKRVGTPA